MAGEASGSEILSYHGDPGLAAGDGLSQTNVNPLAGVDKTLDHIKESQSQERVMDYKQKLKDQDDLAQMLADTGGSVFNMKGPNGQNVSFSPLPQDQQILEDRAHEIRSMVLKNPHNYMFNPDYLDKKAQYNQLVNHAGLRSTEYNNYNQYAQKTNDADERAGILNARNAEFTSALTEGKRPEPYLPSLTNVDPIDPTKWNDKNYQQFGSGIESRPGADGSTTDFEVNKYGIPNSEILKPLNDYTSAGLTNAHNAATAFLRLPQAQNPGYIAKMNEDIDRKAAARGIKPVYAATINPDGSIKYNNNPNEILTALTIEKHGDVQSDAKPSDARLKQATERLQQTKLGHDMRHADAELALKEKEFGLKKDEESRKALEQAKKDKDVYGTISQSVDGVYKSVTAARESANKSLPEVEQSLPGASGSTLAKAFKANSIDPSQYNVAPLQIDETIKHLSGIREKSTSATGVEKELPSSAKPDHAFYIKSKTGDVNDDRYMVGYSETDAKGKKKTDLTWKVIPVNEAINNSVTSHANYGTVKPEYTDKAQEAFKEMIGKGAEKPKAQEDEATITARLIPAKVRTKTGQIINIRIDPVTKKRYAA